jgi:hypothetical protein
MQRPRAGPPLKARAQRLAQLWGVGVGRRDEAPRLDPGELEDAPTGVKRANRLARIEAEELG